MARIRRYFRALILIFALLAPAAAPALAQQPSEKNDLFDRPVLTFDPGRHTAIIRSQAVDEAARFAVTGSDDCSIRVWALEDGRLLNTIFVPVGPDNVGAIYAVAISPDGASIAAGGYTERLQGSHPIYLFDRESGKLLSRIGADLPDLTYFLTFSPDGRFLAATLRGANGLRVFDRDAGWGEIFRDEYPDDSYGAAFSADGSLATTSWDGKIRLYAYDAKATNSNFRLAREAEAPGGKRPRGVAFSPDGALLALGYYDVAAVDLLSAATLEPRRPLRPQGVTASPVGVSRVAWSRDGKTLFGAGGVADAQNRRLLFAWDDGGNGEERRMTYCAADSAAGVHALPGGRILVASTTPCLGLMDAEGRSIWTIPSAVLDFRGQVDVLRLSRNGKIVDFGYGWPAKVTLRFDIAALQLSSASLDETLPPKREGLNIEHWRDDERPTLDGKLLPFTRHDAANSLAFAADASRFFLGSAYAIAAFDAAGAQKWRRRSRDEIWAVNASTDGRLVVTAGGDGALRWRRADDGRELLALQVIPNKDEPAQWDWVLWTPEGFYAATPGAEDKLKWVVNHGPDQAATTFPVSSTARFNRPDALKLVLDELETFRALGAQGLAEASLARCDVQAQTGSAQPPGAVLRVLAIGIDRFGENAPDLHLDFAAADARDVASALLDSQKKASCGPSLYTDVLPTIMTDATEVKPTRINILKAIDKLVNTMREQDVAVILLSTHGAMIGKELYIIPYGVELGAIGPSALSVEELATEVQKVAEKGGKVIMLIDACHSGTVGPDKFDASALNRLATMNAVALLTSSQRDETSEERKEWGHGAFTRAFLDALQGDALHRGTISIDYVAIAMKKAILNMTEQRQHLGPHLNFVGDDVFNVNH